MPVGDKDLGFTFQRIDPNAVAGVKSSVRSVGSGGAFFGARTDGLEMFKILIEAADFLTAVAVHDVNVAISSNRDIRRAGPVKFLRGRTFLLNVSNGVKDLA